MDRMSTNDQSRPSPRPIAIGVAVVTAVVSVAIRLIPYGVRPPNVAANGSLGLFGGARTPLWLAAPLLLLSMVVSDVLLYQMFGWKPFNLYVYGSLLIYLLLGRVLLKNTSSLGR